MSWLKGMMVSVLVAVVAACDAEPPKTDTLADPELVAHAILVLEEVWANHHNAVDIQSLLDDEGIEIYVDVANRSSSLGTTYLKSGGTSIIVGQLAPGCQTEVIAHELMHVLCKYELGVSLKDNCDHRCGDTFIRFDMDDAYNHTTVENEVSKRLEKNCGQAQF